MSRSSSKAAGFQVRVDAVNHPTCMCFLTRGICGRPAVSCSYRKSYWADKEGYFYICNKCISNGWDLTRFDLINPKLVSML